jgi:hypothetical protein
MRDEYTRMLHQSPEYRQKQLSAALDGMLPPDEQAALDAHLAGCVTCARELEELRQVRSLLRAMPQPALPRSFLLPTGDAAASSRTAVQGRQPVPAVTPEWPPARRSAEAARAMRTLRATRWIGTIAAMLGLALFLGTLLPMLTLHGTSYSAAAPASNGTSAGQHIADTNTAVTQPARPMPTHTFTSGGPNQDKSATATVTASPSLPTTSGAPTSAVQNHAIAETNRPALAEILRVIAIALIVIGAGLALIAFFIGRLI